MIMTPQKTSLKRKRDSILPATNKSYDFECEEMIWPSTTNDLFAPKSYEENLMPLFKNMWINNMLLKNVLDNDAPIKTINKDINITKKNKERACQLSTDNMYKTIWILNTLINYELSHLD